MRRTDKVGTEAAFHGIDEYMYHVNEWYALYESIHATPVKPRRVYLATDEPNLLDEAKKKYVQQCVCVCVCVCMWRRTEEQESCMRTVWPGDVLCV